MAHTPGPWKVTTNLDYWVETEADDPIAHCGDISWEGYEGKQYTWEANARLIAAAPDLLLAVKCLCEEMADYMTINKLGDPLTKHNYRLGMAAIAKAETP